MIPVRGYRIVISLLGVSLLVAGVDYALMFIGLRGSSLFLATGIFTGIIVFLMAMEGGFTLRFCAKGLMKKVESPHLDEVLYNLGNVRVSVSVLDSKRLFAITVPEGSGHRIFVSNYLLGQFSKDALYGVMAHELGHIQHKHPAKQAILLGLVAGMKMTFGISLVQGLAILFLYLWVLREWEFIADSEAKNIAGHGPLVKAFYEYHAVSGDKEDASLFSELLSGHPCFARRLARIERSGCAKNELR